jgi:hypothetical protein
MDIIRWLGFSPFGDLFSIPPVPQYFKDKLQVFGN